MRLLFIALTLCVVGLYAESIPNFSISNGDLENFANELRRLDDNKAKPGQIVMNYQGHTNTRDTVDNANGKLFSKVDASLLLKPSYEQFLSLTNNFNRNVGSREPSVTANEERNEINEFISTIFNTKPWKALYSFLNSKGHPFASDPSTWRKWIAQLWFAHYSRARGVADTSGFEHVFIGEAKNGEVSGLHNWVRFYQLENSRNDEFDYKGFIVKRFNIFAAVKFTWFKELKRTGSFLIGTSPEHDMALYTLCFLSRRGRQTCDVSIDGCPFSVTSFDIVQNNKVYIGTMYPTAGRLTDQCRNING